MAGWWQRLARQRADWVKTRCSELLWEGEMGDMKLAARRRREGRGSADTCQANPSPGGGNPPGLAWSRWEVSVGLGEGALVFDDALDPSQLSRKPCKPLKAMGTRWGEAAGSCLQTTASQM